MLENGALQRTGQAMRDVIDRFLTPAVLEKFERAPNECPFDAESSKTSKELYKK